MALQESTSRYILLKCVRKKKANALLCICLLTRNIFGEDPTDGPKKTLCYSLCHFVQKLHTITLLRLI